MDEARKFRLERELARNKKRIEDCLKEAEILDSRNADIHRELGLPVEQHPSRAERNRRRRENNKNRRRQQGGQ